MTITAGQTIAALNVLRSCRSRLLEIRRDALAAATALSGVRANRACELADKVADALAHCERLAFILEGDLRADTAGRSTMGDLQNGCHAGSGSRGDGVHRYAGLAHANEWPQ